MLEQIKRTSTENEMYQPVGQEENQKSSSLRKKSLKISIKWNGEPTSPPSSLLSHWNAATMVGDRAALF